MVSKDLKNFSSCAVLCFLLGISPASATDAISWDNLKEEAEKASEGSTINVTKDVVANGNSIELLQKVLTIDFNGNTVTGGADYGEEPPFLFAGSGSSETNITVQNAVFKNISAGEEGVLYSSNPHLEVIDVSFLNNKGTGDGVAINNSAYNKLVITAKNSNVEISNNNSTGEAGGSGNGIFSNSSVYLNAHNGKTISIGDVIKIDSGTDGNLNINNTFKSHCDLNGTVYLDKKVNFAYQGQVINLGAKSGYKNGTLKLGVDAANSNDFRLVVGGEATLDLQNKNIDSMYLRLINGSSDEPIHLKLEYNGETGKMDCMRLDNDSTVTGDPYFIVDDIVVLKDGNKTETKFIENPTFPMDVSKETISSVSGGKTYVFKPVADSTKIGSYLVSKAKNISDLPAFIQDAGLTNDTEVALTQDIVLDASLGDLTGADRETTVFGNGHTVDANGYSGVTVNSTQNFGFNKVTLKNFNTPTAIENTGTVNLTSTTLDNSIIKNEKTLNLYGQNEFTKGLITGTNGDLNIVSGMTNVGSDFTVESKNITLSNNVVLNNKGTINSTDSISKIINQGAEINNDGTINFARIDVKPGGEINNNGTIVVDFFNLGGTGPANKSAVLNNSGTIEVVNNNFNLNKADIYNKVGGKIILSYMQDLWDIESNVVNDGTIEFVGSNKNYFIGYSTTFLNGETGLVKAKVLNYGDLINNGKIEGDVQNGYAFGPTEYYGGTLTSNIDNISGKIDTFTDSSVFNITGGTISHADKIYRRGAINIVGDVTSDVLLDGGYTGEASVSEGGKLIINLPDTNVDKLFSESATITLKDKSALDIKDKNVDLTANDKVKTEAGTVYIVANKGGKINFAQTSDIKNDKFDVSELTLSNNHGEWQINDSHKDKFAFADDIKLVKDLSADSVKYVTYDKTTGNVKYDSTSEIDNVLLNIQNKQGNSHYYDVKHEERLYPSTTELNNGTKLIVNGNNNIVMGLNTNLSGNEDTKLILNNTNLKASTINLDGNSSLTVNNTSGEAISIDDGAEITATGEQKVHFKGTSDISLSGRFIGKGSAEANGVVDLENATLTRRGNDRNIHWTLNSGTLKYLSDSFLSENSLTMNGGSLDLRNGEVTDIQLQNLNVLKTSKIYVDADLAQGKMDNFLSIAGSASVANDAKIQIDGIKLLSDSTGKTVSIPFADNPTIAAAVEFTGEQGIYYSPIYKYFVDYDEDSGKFEFARFSSDNGGGGDDDKPSNFNPAVLSSPIAAQGVYLAQLQSYDTALANMDMLMAMPKEERQAMKYQNKFAAADEQEVYTFSPNQIPEETKGIWFRPYSSFESVDMSGASVSNVMYGSIVGGDSGIIEHKNGWDAMYSAYAGYNGSHQNYETVGIYQNGGLLGVSGVWYKNNFFTGLTANVGASAAHSSTADGSEDFTMLSTGIASKTGYNWLIADGKFVIQPSYMMSYTFVNTFDYTNASGVRISSDPLNSIQIAPGVKFIGNFKNGWQPYIGVQMVWNIMNKTKFKANDVQLPELSVDPYVQYGFGVQKRIGENFTGFGEAMFRGGGRNGVAFNVGFRWALGKDKK